MSTDGFDTGILGTITAGCGSLSGADMILAYKLRAYKHKTQKYRARGKEGGLA